MTTSIIAAVKALLQANRGTNPRYGGPRRTAPSIDVIAAALPRDLRMHAQTLATVADDLDLDDLGVGTDLEIHIAIDGTEQVMFALSADAFLKTAMRTGLYLPGNVTCQLAEPEDDDQANLHDSRHATATAWTTFGGQAVPVTATVWLEDYLERAQGSPFETPEWQLRAEAKLSQIAQVAAARVACAPYLDSIESIDTATHWTTSPEYHTIVKRHADLTTQASRAHSPT